jgi:hypothetical protein
MNTSAPPHAINRQAVGPKALTGTPARAPEARCRGERGFALPTAIIILFIITLLLAAAVGVATQTSKSTTRDANVKAEIEAAEAGLQVAAYRMSQLAPKSTECVNGSEHVTTKCESGVESLGNNATFQYWTTLPLKSGETCAGRSVVAISGKILRCVTAEGLVNTVKPGVRVQELVSGAPGESLFGIKGMVGLTEFKMTGSVSIPVAAVSNGKIIGEGSANFEKGYEICPPSGSFVPAAAPSTERKKSGVKIAGQNPEPVPEYEKTRAASECPLKAELPATHATEASNEDARIGVQDALVGGTWNQEKHELKLEGTNELTLSGSKYFFCNLIMGAKGSEKLKIAVGAKVEIFIDTPEDKEAKCAAGTGRFEITGGAQPENETKNPANFFIEIFGKGVFELAHGSTATLEAAIYDPGGEININGGTKFKGGILGNKVHLEAGATIFEWSEELGGLNNGSGGTYARESWEQCTAGAGPSEGC